VTGLEDFDPAEELRRIDDEMHRRGVPTCTLKEFSVEAWHVIEPGTPYVDNWHAAAICDHLEAVTRGEITNLLINVPPGTSKSTFTCVMWPAWIWSFRPEWRWLFATYADNLSLRDAGKARLLLESDWYKAAFRPTWRLQGDTNAKGYYANSRMGFRVSTSVGGAGTGLRGDAIVVDDPLNAKEAVSGNAIEEVKHWWDQAFSNRLNDMRTGRRVIIMQRLHEDDLSGHVLAKGIPKFEHLCLPAEFERKRRCTTSLPFSDPRTSEGELLFPERFPVSVLKEELAAKGSSGYAGQYQQRPAPAAGNRFLKTWWRWWKPDGVGSPVLGRPDGCNTFAATALPGRLDDCLISVDCTFKGASRAAIRSELDYVSIVVVGKVGANKFILDRRHGKVGIAQTLGWIRELRADYPRARRILVEDKANGSAVIELLQDELEGIIAIQPEGGKEARAAACEPQIEAGNVYLPDGAPWADGFVEEFALFPNGRHDDQVDSLTQALVWWINGGRDRERARKMGVW
jgi:predicted phage terminase large subunit-like protein